MNWWIQFEKNEENEFSFCKFLKFPEIPAGNLWDGGFPGIPEREFPVALMKRQKEKEK